MGLPRALGSQPQVAPAPHRSALPGLGTNPGLAFPSPLAALPGPHTAARRPGRLGHRFRLGASFGFWRRASGLGIGTGKVYFSAWGRSKQGRRSRLSGIAGASGPERILSVRACGGRAKPPRRSRPAGFRISAVRPGSRALGSRAGSEDGWLCSHFRQKAARPGKLWMTGLTPFPLP